MTPEARLLFHELAGLSPRERERIFSERSVQLEVRSEVESLLSYDSPFTESISNSVSDAARGLLDSAGSGEVILCGPYKLVRLIGSGGMAAVYLGERADGEIEGKVAVKLLSSQHQRPGWRERFLRERQLLASLNHPSIVHVMDAGHTEQGSPYLVMEYVDGQPIDEYASGLPLRERLKLLLKVCEGIAHAHSRLIIHRDLKPSNILVDRMGQPKVLDFGIAKLLDEAGHFTRTADRLLTPGYASPEQLIGDTQTTATDIYSLGAILYKLLTGHSPHEMAGSAAIALEVIAGSREIAPPSRANGPVLRDLDCIALKALRREAKDRYSSVEALAGDIRAFLESRPVEARSGTAWYRTGRFLRRYWMPAAALAVTLGALSAGMYVANRERAVAQRRFEQVRQLANKFIELDGDIRALPGSTAARHRIVSTSVEYLERLSAEARTDRGLALEVGSTWLEVARVQGLPSGPNLGDLGAARASLAKAESLIDSVLQSGPAIRGALLRSAEIAHEQMIVASTMQLKEGVVAEARKVADRQEAMAKLGALSASETVVLSRLLTNVAMAHYNMQLYPEAVDYAKRTGEFAGTVEPAQRYRAMALSVMANSLRNQGDVNGALQAITESKRVAEGIRFPTETARIAVMYPVILREGMVLGQHDNINLGRREEALASIRRAFEMVEGEAARDPKDARSRIVAGSSGLELVGLLTGSDPAAALAIADRCILRLREVVKNVNARRGEAMLLAASSYALRRLQRPAEARQRIDLGLKLLREAGDYPTKKVNPEGEVEVVMRALADHNASTGEAALAVRVYRDLLDGLMVWPLAPETDMLHANALTRVWRGLADAYRRAGQINEANEYENRRRELWKGWDQRIAENVYVKRQLAMIP